MSAVENINPEKEPVPASWVPRVITGGKGPPGGSGPVHNWLVDLPIGTTFVAQPVGSEVEMNLYHVDYSSEEVCLLTWRLPDGKFLDMYVNPDGFCKRHKNYKVLGVTPIAQEQEEEHGKYDPDGDRAD